LIHRTPKYIYNNYEKKENLFKAVWVCDKFMGRHIMPVFAPLWKRGARGDFKKEPFPKRIQQNNANYDVTLPNHTHLLTIYLFDDNE
jgi:hypothetical protein